MIPLSHCHAAFTRPASGRLRSVDGGVKLPLDALSVSAPELDGNMKKSPITAPP